MDLLFLILAGICFLVMVVTGIWLIILAFRQSFLWGCTYMIVPFVAIVFVIKFWDEAKKPFLINLGAWVLLMGLTVLFPNALDSGGADAPPTFQSAETLPAPADRRPPQPETRPIPGAADRERDADPLEGLSSPSAEGVPGEPIPAPAPQQPQEDPNALPPPALPRAEPQNPRTVVGPPVSSRGAPSPETRRIRVLPNDAAGYVGSLVEVVTIEKQRQKVILEGVDEDKLYFDADGFHYSLPKWRVREMWIDNP